MAEINTHRIALLNTFEQLEQDFKHAKIQVETLETQFLDALSAVATSAKKDPLSDSQLRQDHPLRSHVADSVSDIADLVSEWQQKIKNAERHTNFRERYGDSLLVFVYGKVKAGKSSFGNFIAYGKTDPSNIDIESAEPLPKFFIEETTAKTEATNQATMASQRQFGVGRTETTSAIQGFCLPGLTWVDSPGLHSKTEANGKLAQDYVDAADLVLFLSHSNAPGRRSDLQEIQNLGLKNHTLAVVITGSDTYEEDEDDAGNLIKTLRMKSDEDREAQKHYVQQELNNIAKEIALQHPGTKSLLKEAKAFSVSAWFAEQSDELNSWDISGMSNFVSFIAKTAQGRGIKIKKARPLENLRSCLKT
jgi:predicted GTPase